MTTGADSVALAGSRWRVRGSVAGLFLACGAEYGAWAASVAGVKERLGASDGELGAALLCVAFGAILAMPIAGWLGAKRVPRVLTLTGLFVAVALPLPGLVGSVPSLAAVLLVLGAAAGSLDVCMNARASRVEQGWGLAIMSSFHAAFSLGGLLGTGLEALGEWLGWGVEGGLLATSAVLLVAVGVHVVCDERPDLAEAGGRIAWPTRAVAGIGVLCGLAFLCEGAVADWSGVYLRSVAGFGGPGSASGFAAFSAAMVLMRLLGDTAVRRFGRTRMLRYGALVAGLGVVLAIAVPGVAPAGFFLVGLGAANAAPILFSAAGRVGPTALAAVATLGYGGMLLGPPMIGGLAELIGLRLALLVLAAAMGAIAMGARWGVR